MRAWWPSKERLSTFPSPGTAADASLVAFEHVLLGDDNHRGELRYSNYAESVAGDHHWQFWWD